MKNNKLHIKIADEPWELMEICRLNHQTFAEEFQQHEKTATGFLTDKFHSENQYIICLEESEIVGMIALRDTRPFSLDYKLDNLDSYLPPHKLLCEIRLLTIKPKYRNTHVFFSLFKETHNQFIKKQYDCALISGILLQQKLYRSLGFVPFGPLVGGSVKFQPMYTTPEFFSKSRHNTFALNPHKTVNLLPGPVDINDIVVDAYKNKPESHRSENFIENYQEICKSLSNFVRSCHTQIFTGSATLANEIMLAHIAVLNKKGLILSNGEFGDRIIHQATCQKINFEAYKVSLGLELNLHYIKNILDNDKEIQWLFFVHSETSTGVLNDFTGFVDLCYERNILVLVDCVSSFGIVPLDLARVYMASASSGKAIGSFSGLSMIFFNDLLPVPENKIPLYLDIWYYVKKNGIPFTLNSNALNALGSALEIIDLNSKYNTAIAKTSWLRNEISKLFPDFHLIESTTLHPAIITIELPIHINSYCIGKSLEKSNVLINYNSHYLIKQNMVQLCLFSSIDDDVLKYIISTLKKALVMEEVILN